MSRIDELLIPISGPTSAGINLRYDPVYDKIKEARREDEVLPQGEWERELKKADWPLVIKLCSEALGQKTKDLQLAAWLTEALLHCEGLSGLHDGLELVRRLLEQFWEGLYPEIEDGDCELRAMPLDWLGSRLGDSIRKVPLTASGLDWCKYKESRAIGYEEAVADSESKREAREQALADGKLTPEEFDKAFGATPKSFYVRKMADIEGCAQSIQSLSQLCDSKFENSSPSFVGFKDSLATIGQSIKELLARKREAEPDEPVESAEVTETAPEQDIVENRSIDNFRAPAAQRASARKVDADPSDRDDAYSRIASLSAWLRKDDPYNPVPYLIVRAMRWGELRGSGSDLDLNLLEAPSSSVRTKIKQLLNDGNYDELFGVIEEAAAQPCGRGWLDLQRYFCKACDDAGGYNYVKRAVQAELTALLCDYATLPEQMLLDDTPAANPETRDWLEALLAARKPEPECSAVPVCLAVPAIEPDPPVFAEVPEAEAVVSTPADAFEVACEAVSSGKTNEAVRLLIDQVSQGKSGRARFQRRVQLAQICIAAGRENVALPILEALADEIEGRRLEQWESADVLAHVLGLLYQCLGKLGEDSELRQTLYARICRLDPIQAMQLAR